MILLGFALLLSAGLTGCGGSDEPQGIQCPGLGGTPWVPQVSNASPSNHNGSMTLSQTEIQAFGPITGLAQPAPESREISVTIDMSQDLGPTGSLTLMAQVVSLPPFFNANVFAYLTSLSDGTNEYVNLARAGTGGDCAASGYYVCPGTVCTSNPNCKINWPSAYTDREHWEQHQGYASSAENLPSINTFPTCNWTGGSGQSATDPSCAFNTQFFPTGITPNRLRYGVNYTAKYVLISDSHAVVNGRNAGMKVTVLKKANPNTAIGGAVDVNFILVGTKNVNASRTAKGQQNLNTAVTAVADYYAQSNSNIKLGTVRGVEWPCDSGGDQYANVDVSNLGKLFSNAVGILPPGSDAKAINVFLVSTIVDSSADANSNLTILGVDGAIGGPATNGTAVSGMAVSTFEILDQYNPNCGSSNATCPLTQQEESFFQLSDTITHEMGHFFGLNHLSERDGKSHDFVRDTPVCTAADVIGQKSYLTIHSCLLSDTNIFSGTSTTCLQNCASYTTTYSPLGGQFCPLAQACQFNNVMWWTTKNFDEKTGNSDGVKFSAQQGIIMNFHPLVQ
jgi:hypothetical protein